MFKRLRSRLSRVLQTLYRAAERFFPSFVCSIVLSAVTVLLLENLASSFDELLGSLLVGLLAALFASVPACLAMEYRGVSRRKALLVECAASLGFGALFFAMRFVCVGHFSEWMPYFEMALVGFMLLCAALSYVLLMDKTTEHTLFMSVCAAATYGIALSILLSALLGVCLFAFQTLIFALPDLVHEVILSLTMVALPVNAFLALVPRRAETPRAFLHYESVDKLILSLLSAIYMGLLSILLLYVGKILFTRQMPVGEMNWYASFALLYYLLLWLTPAPKSDGAANRLYTRWGGWLLLPVILVQIYGIGVRFAAYGLTLPRYISMVCLALGVFALALTLTRRSLRPVFPAAIAAIALLSFSPLNAIDVPAMEQEARLHRLLAQNDMIVTEADTGAEFIALPEKTIPAEARERILSCVSFLRSSPSLRCSAFWKANFTGETENSIDKILDSAVDEDALPKTYYYQGTNQTLGTGIDVTGYAWVLQLSTRSVKTGSAEIALTLPNGEELSYDLSGHFDAIVKRYGYSTREANLRIELDDRATLLLSYLEVRYGSNHTFQRCQFSGALLVRK